MSNSGSGSNTTLEVIVGCKVAFKYGRTRKVGIVVGHDGSYEGSRPWKVYFSGVTGAGGEGSYKWSFRNASDLKVLDYFDSAESTKAALQELASEKVAISEWDRLYAQFSSPQKILEGNSD